MRAFDIPDNLLICIHNVNMAGRGVAVPSGSALVNRLYGATEAGSLDPAESALSERISLQMGRDLLLRAYSERKYDQSNPTFRRTFLPIRRPIFAQRLHADWSECARTPTHGLRL